MKNSKQKKNILGSLNSLKLNKPGRLLVFESTGSSLYGVIVRSGFNSSFFASAPAMSHAPNFTIALGEVLEQLRQQTKKRLPKTAVLITPSAAGKLLPLPVDPKNPRPQSQMRELVRWELEELFVRHNDIWSLGGLLMGRGHISAEQRLEAEKAAVADPRTGSGSGMYEGIVTSEQLDECRTLLEHFTAVDDELVTGWSPQAGSEEDEEGFTWYAAGIGEGIRSQWVRAFKKNGLFLSWIYPQLGAALPLIAPEEKGWILVDIRQEQFGLFRGYGGKLDSISVKSCPSGIVEPSSVAEAVRELILPDTNRIYFSAPADLVAPLFAEFEQGSDRRDIKLSLIKETDAGESCPATVLASLEGAARHALKLSKSGIPVRIAAQDPKAPVWKRREYWPWAAILLLTAVIASYDIHMRIQSEKNEWNLEVLEIELGRRKTIKRKAQETAVEMKRLEEELVAKQSLLEEQERLRDVLNNVIRYRHKLIPGILEALSGAVSDEVVLNLLEENPDRSGFYIEGWALRDTEGQLFGNRLNEALAPWHYKVADLQLERGKGRLNLEGFILKIWLEKTESKVENKDV